MAIETFSKDPDAVLDYGFDWSEWLASGESISTSEWTVPDGLTKDSDTSDSTKATIWLSGGTAGNTYEITNTITTDAGRTDERTMKIRVVER